MPTYSDEVNVYNPNAIDDAIGEAATTATSYITTVDQTGIMVHPASDSTSGWKISSAIELLKNGVSYIKAWLAGTNNDVPTVQIGASANGNYALIDDDSFDIYHGNTQMAHFGYGEGSAESGTSTAPYYTLGTRRTTTSVYSSSNTYAIGDNVLYNDIEYVCNTEISTPEAWNAGHWNRAIGNYSVAEGSRATASGLASHAEGSSTKAVGQDCHAEGSRTTASGLASHAEGSNTIASGHWSHAEGRETVASSSCSHAQGNGTIAASAYQTAIGEWNVADPYRVYAFIIGNGESKNIRSNALAVRWDGTVEHANDIVTTTPSDVLTPASGVTINFANYQQWGKVASMYVSCKKSSAIAGSTATALFTMKEGRRPLFENVGNMPAGRGDCYVNGEGIVSVRQDSQISANTNIYIRITYLLA